jgi:hypothetical protein
MVVKETGRFAGLAYLVVIVLSIPGYVTLTRLLNGDPHAALASLATSRTAFVLAVASSALGFLAWIVLGALLYRLMSSAGRVAGVCMVIFAIAGTAMNLIALWQLLPLAGPSDSMDSGAVASIVNGYKRLLQQAQLFSGLWLFPFGWLVVRSRVVPRVLGFCLILAGFFWLLQFATAFEPGLDRSLAFRIASAPTGISVMIGEFGTCLWLLIRGARDPEAGASTSRVAMPT